jgi:hypothetical protein
MVKLFLCKRNEGGRSKLSHCPGFLFLGPPFILRATCGVVSCTTTELSVARLSLARSLARLKTATEEETDAQQSRTLDRARKSGVSAESCACFQAGDCKNLTRNFFIL